MRIAVPAIEPMFTDHDMNAPPVAGRDDSRRGKHGVAVTQVPGWRPLPGTRKSIVLIDRTMIALQAFLRVDTPAACALFGMVNVSLLSAPSPLANGSATQAPIFSAR